MIKLFDNSDCYNQLICTFMDALNYSQFLLVQVNKSSRITTQSLPRFVSSYHVNIFTLPHHLAHKNHLQNSISSRLTILSHFEHSLFVLIFKISFHYFAPFNFSLKYIGIVKKPEKDNVMNWSYSHVIIYTYSSGYCTTGGSYGVEWFNSFLCVSLQTKKLFLTPLELQITASSPWHIIMFSEWVQTTLHSSSFILSRFPCLTWKR